MATFFQRTSSVSTYGGLTPVPRPSLASFRSNTTIVASSEKSSKFLKYLNLVIIGFVLAGFGMCSSLFAPFFPTEAEHRGVSATTVGMIFSVFTLVMFIGSLVSGGLVRHLGLHFMIGCGTLLAAGATMLFGLLDKAPPGDSYVALCFITRFVEGVGASLYNTAVFSMVAILFTDNISTGYAVLEMSFAVGAMIGPTIGGALFKLGGFPLPFYVVGALLFVLGGSSQLLLRFTFHIEENDNKSEDSSASQPLSWSYFYKNSYEIWILTIAETLISIVYNFPSPTLSLYLSELGTDDAFVVGIIFFLGALCYGIMSIVAGKLADSYCSFAYMFIAAGSLVVCLAYLVIGPIPPLLRLITPSVGLTTGCFIVSCLGLAFAINPSPSMIMRAAKRVGYSEGLDTSSMMAAIYNAMWYFGSFSGTLLGGLLIDEIGFQWAGFTMSAIAFSVLTIISLTILFQLRYRKGYGASYEELKDESEVAEFSFTLSSSRGRSAYGTLP